MGGSKKLKKIPDDHFCLNLTTIKIGCKDNKPYLITPLNIDNEDLSVEMTKIYTDIKNHYTSLTCADIDELQGTTLYTGETKEAIAIKQSDSDILQKIKIYRMLNFRKGELENKHIKTDDNLKVNVICENNTIKAEFE